MSKKIQTSSIVCYEPSEEQKALLRRKIEKIAELEREKLIIEEERKHLLKAAAPLKQSLQNDLVDGPKRVQWETCLVERVSKKQQRRPTLEMTYRAIKKVLGDTGVKEIKDEVKRLKQETKQKKVKTTVIIVPTGDLRKPRKDKKTTSTGRKGISKKTTVSRQRFLKKLSNMQK
jgi:hypothetical protein